MVLMTTTRITSASVPSTIDNALHPGFDATWVRHYNHMYRHCLDIGMDGDRADRQARHTAFRKTCRDLNAR